MKRPILTAIFFNSTQTEQACVALFEKGYKCRDINLIITAETWKKYFQVAESATEIHKMSRGKTTAEKPKSAVVKGLRDVIKLARIMPGLDVLVAGPIGRYMDTEGPEGICTGILGAFKRCGMPKSLSSHYEQEVMGGGIMLGVQPQFSTDLEPISSLLQQHNGTHIHHGQIYKAIEP